MSFLKFACGMLLILSLFYAEVSFAPEHLRVRRYENPYIIQLSGQRPWIVQQEYSGQRGCTGFLITNQCILTAAHCYRFNKTKNNAEINFINHNSPFKRTVTGIALHPVFKTKSPLLSRHDIAVVQFTPSVAVEPAVLVSSSGSCEDYENRLGKLRAAGYEAKPDLKEVSVGCEEGRFHPKPQDHLFFRLIYRGNAEGGDSGGPLFSSKLDANLVVGLLHASYNRGGGPMLFTPIADNLDFLQEFISFQLIPDDNLPDLSPLQPFPENQSFLESSALSDSDAWELGLTVDGSGESGESDVNTSDIASQFDCGIAIKQELTIVVSSTSPPLSTGSSNAATTPVFNKTETSSPMQSYSPTNSNEDTSSIPTEVKTDRPVLNHPPASSVDAIQTQLWIPIILLNLYLMNILSQ